MSCSFVSPEVFLSLEQVVLLLVSNWLLFIVPLFHIRFMSSTSGIPMHLISFHFLFLFNVQHCFSLTSPFSFSNWPLNDLLNVFGHEGIHLVEMRAMASIDISISSQAISTTPLQSIGHFENGFLLCQSLRHPKQMFLQQTVEGWGRQRFCAHICQIFF